MATGKYHRWLEPEGLTLLRGWARDGLTDEQIAHNMGISARTLDRWKHDHSPICRALKSGKEVADYEVENSLYRMATGYWNEETAIDAKGNEHTVMKWYPPNVTAAIYWTKNRRPDKWREKREEQAEKQSAAYVAILPERTKIDDLDSTT